MAVVELSVNGKGHKLDVEPARNLLSVLRDDLDLCGSKYGCGEGRCGACTVLVDGQPVRSCITRIGECRGKQITTIESLERDGRLHPLQQAFLDADAMQCGYCTSGMIMSALALLTANSSPTGDDIVRAMEGNICRCGTYARIVTAVSKAATGMQEARR
jgi:aerobic-type carbon monoxide dehydrogenase small subunit (CoxS/CutS family)